MEIVFDPAGSGYHTFRIPSVVARGSLVLAFCEGRLNGSGDAGEIEIVLRRSLDGGQTWLPVQVVSAKAGKTCGNPVPLFDPVSGDVVLVTVENGADAVEMSLARGTDPESGRRVFVQRSSDDGATWSPTVEITGQVKRADWGWYATGPMHGIQLTRGAHAGRMVAGTNFDVGTGTATKDAAQLVYSDDKGETWHKGATDLRTDDQVPQEVSVVEKVDGGILAMARNNTGGPGVNRMSAVSNDGGQTYTAPYKTVDGLVTPTVQTSLQRLRAVDEGA